jgi:hypothetical protein
MLGLALALALALGPWACLLEIDRNKLHPAAVDAGGPSEAGADAGAAPAPYLGLACGNGHCDGGSGHVCCASTYGDPDYGNGACSTKDQCRTGDFFVCESPRDCDGLPACCVVRLKGGAFTSTSCAAACAAGATRLCDPSSNGSCPPGTTCRPSSEFPNLSECAP